MSTDELISRLSRNIAPVPRHALEKRFIMGVSGGFLASGILLFLWLGFRPDLSEVAFTRPFLTKLLYTVALFAASIPLSLHLMRPEGKTGRSYALLFVPVLVLGLAATAEFSLAPHENRAQLLFGHGVLPCLIRILIISTPIFAGLLWSAKSFAPTRLRAAGAAAGLMSGSLAAGLYAFHCIEPSASFVFVWYSLGIAITSALGALLAPLVLRW
ncbi:NrsF family protein [Hyphococcus sp.]|uniref:NrsF family protein n=1 Tax=Hyphococcus sp. TaxID=2038636 RepID=UPI0020832996|nr:MAG: membrane protein [Marinicaulis sp.]